MKDVKVFDDTAKLAKSAAELTVKILRKAIDESNSATWVLAGGSTPLAAYEVIASTHSDSLDWSKVTIIIGDERIGPLDGPDNNWHAIEKIIGILPTKKLRPISDKSPEDVVMDYEEKMNGLPKSDNGLPRFDLAWLGVGADGHTLSMFPNHSSLLPKGGGLVSAVYDSPKPPAERISLTLRAMQGTKNAIVLATGKDKKAAIEHAVNGGQSPIALVANIIETHEGHITFMIDRDAAPSD